MSFFLWLLFQLALGSLAWTYNSPFGSCPRRARASLSPIDSTSRFATRTTTRATSTTTSFDVALETNATSEVVGGAGRIGSFFLRAARQNDEDKLGPIAVPRGVIPGCLSKDGNPIYVTVPSDQWKQIHQLTPLARREDLVWIGNGLLSSSFQKDSTVVIPHFGILQVNGDPVTSSSSPPTFVYGKHGDEIVSFLSQHDIPTERVTDWNLLRVYAARKLLWSSCLWLLCHSLLSSSDQDVKPAPLTVRQVHESELLRNQLGDLVSELLPQVERVVGVSLDKQQTLDYMEAYSLSMPEAIPSKDLALRELRDRNGVWLQKDQSLHLQLLKKVLDIDDNDTIMSMAAPRKEERNDESTKVNVKFANLDTLGISCTASNMRRVNKRPKSVVIIGGGIMGSSIALSLARSQQKSSEAPLNITVYDPTPCGVTSPASWAWLNAQKNPPQYKWLNQMGLRGWRLDPVFQSLPKWGGSLLCFPSNGATMSFPGGYRNEGPLSQERIKEIEPQASLLENENDGGGFVMSFPDEGCVDPCEAVEAVRMAAIQRGVTFSRQNVTNILRDDENGGHIVGVRLGDNTTKAADVVVVAAGTGAAALEFGGLPLLSSPGRISYVEPNAMPVEARQSGQLKVLLVDMVCKSHLLQQKDGTFVAGGGALVVAGSGGKQSGYEKPTDEGQAIMDGAARLISSDMLENVAISKSEQAVRPMPQDGLSAIGFIQPGLYTAVTHSGFTLAPALGSMIATEVLEDVDLDLLRSFRPSRFFEPNQC